MKNIADIRKEYTKGALEPKNMGDNPLVEFRGWFQQALDAQVLEPNAMVLGTTDGQRPSSRTVLLKAFDRRGFVFFTNYDSAKGQDLAAKPRACLLMFWAELERQVRVTGSVTRTTREESEDRKSVV